MRWDDDTRQHAARLRDEHGLSFDAIAERISGATGESLSVRAIQFAVSEARNAGQPRERSARSDLWAEKPTAKLICLWREGKSYGQISQALNSQFGLKLTRSAIAGKVKRLRKAGVQLDFRGSPGRGKPRTKVTDEQAPAMAERRKRRKATKKPENVTLRTAPSRNSAKKVSEKVTHRKATNSGPVLFQHLPDNGCAHRVNSHLEREVWVCGARTARPASAYCPEHEPTRSRP